MEDAVRCLLEGIQNNPRTTTSHGRFHPMMESHDGNRKAAEDDSSKGTEERPRHLLGASVWTHTPRRVAHAILECTEGYAIKNPDAILTAALFAITPDTVPAGGAGAGGGSFSDDSNHEIFEYASRVVSIEEIHFASLCEHHLLPFWGVCSIQYEPRTQVAGLSKFPRVVQAYARRLQLQERLTQEIAECVWRSLNPMWVRVEIQAVHSCVVARGVRQPSQCRTRTVWCVPGRTRMRTSQNDEGAAQSPCDTENLSGTHPSRRLSSVPTRLTARL